MEKKNKFLKFVKSFFACKKNIMLILVFCLTILSVTSSLSLAKYLDSKTGNDGTKVSMFIGDVNTTSAASQIAAMSPGTSRTITFEVTNYKGSLICETNIKYSFVVTTEKNLPLVLTTSANPSKVDANYPTASSDTLSWTNGKMSAGVKTTHEYSIVVEWPSTANDYSYASEVDVVKITLRTEQAL